MKTILLLEDHPAVRESLGAFLQYKGKYCVLGAGDESEALELCHHHGSEIDLLIADVIVGTHSGRDIAERLKAQCPKLRVLFMSGYPQEHLVRRGLLLRGDPCLAKPFTPNEVLHRVDEILNTPDPRRASAGKNG
jgi:two-component system cell cycle sensor histidine kinase/response regulator CckA